MDESYDNKQQLFALSCLIAAGSDWMAMDRAWKLHLAAKNRQLKKQGRPTISRYHASDCSGRKNEFRDWTLDERDDFVRGLFAIFRRVPTHTVAFDADLDDLYAVFPEWAGDRLRTAYQILTRFVMWTLGEDFERLANRQCKVKLFHDKTGGDGKYDPIMLEAFNAQMTDEHFPYKQYFTTITPLAWQSCMSLQPADLVAFEAFKEAQARKESRKVRKSFDALLNMEAFGIHKKSVPKDAMEKLRGLMEQRQARPPAFTG